MAFEIAPSIVSLKTGTDANQDRLHMNQASAGHLVDDQLKTDAMSSLLAGTPAGTSVSIGVKSVIAKRPPDFSAAATLRVKDSGCVRWW